LTRNLQPRICAPPFRFDDAGPERNAPCSLANRLHRIGDQIHHHLGKLRDIRLHRGQIVREVVNQRRLTRDGAVEQLAHLFDELRNRKRLDQHRLLTRIGEQLSGECGGPLRGATDLLNPRPDRRIGG